MVFVMELINIHEVNCTIKNNKIISLTCRSLSIINLTRTKFFCLIQYISINLQHDINFSRQFNFYIYIHIWYLYLYSMCVYRTIIFVKLAKINFIVIVFVFNRYTYYAYVIYTKIIF